MPMTKHAAATARGMLTGREVAARLAISQRQFERLVAGKRITAYRFGARTVRFKHSDVDAFIERSRV